MSQSRKGQILVTSFVILFLQMCTGCFQDPNFLGPGGIVLAAFSPTYDITYVNLGPSELKQVTGVWDRSGETNFLTIPGGLMPLLDVRNGGGASGLASTAPVRMPDTATIYWSTLDGVMHKQLVELKIPPGNRCLFTGTIWLIYTKNKWVEIPQTHEEEIYRITHDKSMIPDLPN